MNLHCMHEEKFIEPFIDFIERNFDSSKHKYIIRRSERFKSGERKNVIFLEKRLSKLKEFLLYTKCLNRANKIFLHGLFLNAILIILITQPWLLKKCYWVVWGGDLYYHRLRGRNIKSNIHELVRAFVIKRLGHFITFIKGDYELAQQWYGAQGKHHECFTYPSNLYKGYDTKPKKNTSINIQVGNSATETNHHFDVLQKLSIYRDHDIKVFAPLSYGDNHYANRVINYGRSVFGDKFIPILDFVPFDKYLSFLSEIDIAIFNNNRQQAIGNVITLLGLGKKVYMRTEVTSWDAFLQLGLHMFDAERLEITRLPVEQAENNQKIIAAYFSEVNLVAQLRGVFGTESSAC